MDKNIKILKNLIDYLQLKIDNGENKIIYNYLLYDEKTIDCINAIQNLIDYTNNSIPKDVLIEKLDNLELSEELQDNWDELNRFSRCYFSL